MMTTISLNALIKRVNRRLENHGHERLCKTRPGSELRREFGTFYVKDMGQNRVLMWDVDPEAYARELGVLGPNETLIVPDYAD